MTYSYVYNLRNLRPANLLRTLLLNFSMRPQHVRMTQLSFDVWVSFLEILGVLFSAENLQYLWTGQDRTKITIDDQ